MYVRGLPAATRKASMLIHELGMEASSLKGLNPGDISFVSRCTKGCKWPGGAGHGGPRKDGRIIEVGLVLAL